MARVYKSGWRDWFNTASANISKNFMVEGLQEQMQQLDALLASNPQMEKAMQNVIGRVLNRAKKQMQRSIHSSMPNDPRDAYKAVRKAVYRRLLGGNINILQKRRAGSQSTYRPTRTLKSGQRGGNRRARSERTMRMDAYKAEDRGFILRFLNSGARVGGGNRKLGAFTEDNHRGKVKRGSQGGNIGKYGSESMVNTGNRGAIAAKNVFGGHLIELGSYIDRELRKEFEELLKKA